MNRAIRSSASPTAHLSLLIVLAACSRTDDHPAARATTDAAVAISVDAAATSAAGTPARYRGKPMLVVIESYALSVIGELPAEDEARVRLVVQRTFGPGDDWRATVRKTMEWNDGIDKEIRANWDRMRDSAREANVPADPRSFARMFGDEYSK